MLFFLFGLSCSAQGRGRSSAWRDRGWVDESYGFVLGLAKKGEWVEAMN